MHKTSHYTKVPEVREQEIIEIIVKKNTVKLIEVANKLGEYYASGKERDRLSSTQIRNILDRIQRMKKIKKYEVNPDKLKDEVQFLRAPLAYAAGRDRTHDKKMKHLQQILDQAINRINDAKTFKNFCHFFEAIVAYHRYHGGK